MSKCINKVVLLGHLGNDPECVTGSGGDIVAKFSVATSIEWRVDGEKREETEWHNCAAFKQLGEICLAMLKKGTRVYIEGRNKTNKWTDNNGATHYTTNIVVKEMIVLSGGKEKDANQGYQQPQSYQQPPQPDTFEDDDIPF